MTAHPAIVKTVKGLDIQQHSHGIIQHIGNVPCSDAAMRDAYTVSQAYASLQPFMVSRAVSNVNIMRKKGI